MDIKRISLPNECRKVRTFKIGKDWFVNISHSSEDDTEVTCHDATLDSDRVKFEEPQGTLLNL